jgi:hypothetical protein
MMKLPQMQAETIVFWSDFVRLQRPEWRVLHVNEIALQVWACSGNKDPSNRHTTAAAREVHFGWKVLDPAIEP